MLVAILVALGLATLAVLVVAAISLAKQGTRLAASITEFQREMRPLLEEIQADANRVGGRLDELQRARADGPVGGRDRPGAGQR